MYLLNIVGISTQNLQFRHIQLKVHTMLITVRKRLNDNGEYNPALPTFPDTPINPKLILKSSNTSRNDQKCSATTG